MTEDPAQPRGGELPEGAAPPVPGLVSVIVPCYNEREFVAETLDSVLAQEDVPLEIVVVDDASTDGSWDVIASYGGVRACRNSRNRGAPFSRNRGAGLARGEFIMFLDADDILGPGSLAGLRDALREHSAELAFGAWKQLRRSGGRWVIRDPRKRYDPDGDYIRPWLRNAYFPPCAVMWRMTAFRSSGGWDPALLAWQDTDLMLRVLMRGASVVRSDRGEAFYRIYESRDSVSNIRSRRTASSRVRVLDKLVGEAEDAGRLEEFREAIGRAYYRLARTYAWPHAELRLRCLASADAFMARPLGATLPHRVLGRILGLERKERLAIWLSSRGLLSRSRP